MISLNESFNYKKLIRFTLPTIVMLIFTSIYGVVDGIFVSNVAGSDAFAAVNLIMPAIMIVGSIGFMFGAGGSALISKTLGEGKKHEADKYFSTFIYFLIILGIIFSVLGIIFIEPVSIALGAEGKILENCIAYGRCLLIFITPYFLQSAFQSFLITAEKPHAGLVITVIAGCTNMVLDYLFIYVFKMGVTGAAAATGISFIIGGIIPLIYFIFNRKLAINLIITKFDFKAIGKACLNGSSEMITNLSMSLVNMMYNFQLMKFIGSDGVIAYGIIMYVSFIFVGTYLGYSTGIAPVIGYHYGAGNKEELKSLFKKSLIIIACSAVVLTALAEILAGILAGIFVSYDASLMQLTTKAIRIFSISFIISGFNMFASAFFTALNNGLISGLLSFCRTFVFQILMISILPGIFHVNGIWTAIIVAEILALIMSIICFNKNASKYGYMEEKKEKKQNSRIAELN